MPAPLLCALLLSVLQAPLQESRLATIVDSVFAAGMAREHMRGGAVVIVQHGRVILAKGLGGFDPNRTIFPIASISKVFTATAVMQLVDAGKIDLQRDVNQYLRSLRVPSTYPQPVTTAALLSHTAGLDEIPGRQVRSRAEIVPLATFLKDRLVRVHPPGLLTSYSTYAIALAGVLVTDVSGEPFETYLRRHIWEPLGMTRTFITVPSSASHDLASAYELEGDSLVQIPYEIYQTPPASSIVSTGSDMARFMIAHLHNGRIGSARILSDSAARLMHARYATMHPLLPGWTLGFQEDEVNGRRIIEHGGDIGGFSTLMTLLPDEDLGIFVVHQLEGRNLRFDLKRAVLDDLFPDSRPIVIPTPHPERAAALQRFAGTYRASTFCHSCSNPTVQDFAVQANDDGTITAWDDRWIEVSPLYFVRADGRARLGFAADSAGRIIALTRGSWRVLEKR